MEHIDILKKIIEVEQQAQAIADSAEQKRAHLSEDIEKAKENLKNDYAARAKRRIQMVSDAERKAADEKIAGIDRLLNDKMREVETVFQANHGRWVQDLFTAVVGQE